jgi:hypothetical protein
MCSGTRAHISSSIFYSEAAAIICTYWPQEYENVLVLTTSNITDAIGFFHSSLSFSPPLHLPPSQPALVLYSRHPPSLCLRLPTFGYCSCPLLFTPSPTFSTFRDIISVLLLPLLKPLAAIVLPRLHSFHWCLLCRCGFCGSRRYQAIHWAPKCTILVCPRNLFEYNDNIYIAL